MNTRRLKPSENDGIYYTPKGFSFTGFDGAVEVDLSGIAIERVVVAGVDIWPSIIKGTRLANEIIEMAFDDALNTMEEWADEAGPLSESVSQDIEPIDPTERS